MSREGPARIEKRPFGKLASGEPVDLYTLTNKGGVQAQITNYGGAVVSVRTPYRRGVMDDIVLGYDTPQGYEADTAYLGALVGRYANRIAKGKFKLRGGDYHIAQNNGVNHLHGGIKGFN